MCGSAGKGHGLARRYAVADMTEPSTPSPKSRRTEYAEATKQAIIDAARLLFAREGYFATTVEQIARTARVAPATVYAVAGGKQGLMRTLGDVWSRAPIVAESLSRQDELTDPDEVLRQAVGTVRRMREDYGDIMRVLIATAPHSPDVHEALSLATKRYRDAVSAVARRLAETGGLPPGTTVAQASDILWFYLGYNGFFTLVDENGWSYDRAEAWLLSRARTALNGSADRAG